MKTRDDRDPRRWADLPQGAQGVEAEIGAAARLVRGVPPAGPFRLTEADQNPLGRVSNSGSSWGAMRPRTRARTRTTAVVAVSLFLGGAAAALSGKVIQQIAKRGETAVLKEKMFMRPSRPLGTPPARAAARGAIASPALAPVTAIAALAVPNLPPPLASHTGHKVAVAEVVRPKISSAARASVGHPHPPTISGAAPMSFPPKQPDVRAMSVDPPPLAPSDAGRTQTGAWVTPAVKLQPHASPVRPNASEASLVAGALARLRRDRDPLWALDDLDEHDRQYPSGSLRREAVLARAEALLALDRNGDALAVLDSLGLGASATDRRAQLARGELRAQDGRRPEAIGDFDRVLDSGGDDDLAARALYGRAVCRLRGGDLGGARTDLRAYLQRFPAGHNRADVTNMLGRIGG